jgi:hypothetical protein
VIVDDVGNDDQSNANRQHAEAHTQNLRFIMFLKKKLLNWFPALDL